MASRSSDFPACPPALRTIRQSPGSLICFEVRSAVVGQHGLYQAFQVDQPVHHHGQDSRSARPSDPSEKQSEGKDLGNEEPIILDVYDGQQSGGDTDNPAGLAVPPQPGSNKKSTNWRFLADRNEDRYSDQQQWQLISIFRRLVHVTLEAVNYVAPGEPARCVAHGNQGYHCCNGDDDFPAPRRLVAEIFRHAASGSCGHSQQGDLHRRRYKNEQNQRTAILRQGSHLTQPQAVPSAQHNDSGKLTDEERERSDQESCKKTERFPSVAQGSSFSHRPSSARSVSLISVWSPSGIALPCTACE